MWNCRSSFLHKLVGILDYNNSHCHSDFPNKRHVHLPLDLVGSRSVPGVPPDDGLVKKIHFRMGELDGDSHRHPRRHHSLRS